MSLNCIIKILPEFPAFCYALWILNWRQQHQLFFGSLACWLALQISDFPTITWAQFLRQNFPLLSLHLCPHHSFLLSSFFFSNFSAGGSQMECKIQLYFFGYIQQSSTLYQKWTAVFLALGVGLEIIERGNKCVCNLDSDTSEYSEKFMRGSNRSLCWKLGNIFKNLPLKKLACFGSQKREIIFKRALCLFT